VTSAIAYPGQIRNVFSHVRPVTSPAVPGTEIMGGQRGKVSMPGVINELVIGAGHS
jgi:hypothetical protein